MENLTVTSERVEELAKNFSRTDDFVRVMTYYRCAIMEIQTKLNVLNAEFSLQYDRNPFENIESRLKKPESIVEKMIRRNIPLTVGDMEQEMTDIAGIRVICSFQEDLYNLADLLVEQDDVLLISRKDYIANPKPNGYRSLHLLIDIPIFLSQGKKHMKVEVQFRTIAMDFWASVDHKLKYKKSIRDADAVVRKLKVCADTLAMMDAEMEEIRRTIDWTPNE
ncbi:MAG: GTP pyrophosphokinase family protein [Eubacterium sp.]|nr:GTP pyrophosphokinase family protein [Eubacterium sp.]